MQLVKFSRNTPGLFFNFRGNSLGSCRRLKSNNILDYSFEERFFPGKNAFYSNWDAPKCFLNGMKARKTHQDFYWIWRTEMRQTTPRAFSSLKVVPNFENSQSGQVLSVNFLCKNGGNCQRKIWSKFLVATMCIFERTRNNGAGASWIHKHNFCELQIALSSCQPIKPSDEFIRTDFV